MVTAGCCGFEDEVKAVKGQYARMGIRNDAMKGKVQVRRDW